MKNYEIKNIDGGILDVDDVSRRVKIVISETEVKDHDEDVIAKDAYNRTLKHRGPQGKGLIWHLTDHNPSLKSAVARFKELYMENTKLVGVTDIPGTTWGNDVLEMYKTGNINQHSIGFKTNDSEKKGDYTLIKEVTLYEGSAVLWGANEYTPTLSVGKSLTKEDTVNEYAKTIEEINKISKLFKSGHLSDESFELLEIKLQQLTDKLQQLFDHATQLDAKSPVPVEESLLDVYDIFTNTFKQVNNERARKKGARAEERS